MFFEVESRQVSKHSKCTYLAEPLQLHGDSNLFASSVSKQIRHCVVICEVKKLEVHIFIRRVWRSIVVLGWIQASVLVYRTGSSLTVCWQTRLDHFVK
jgi:hypothetical protein